MNWFGAASPKSIEMKVHQRHVRCYTMDDEMNIQSIGYRTKAFEARNLAFFFLLSLGFPLVVGLLTYTGFLHTPQGLSDPILIPWILLNIPVLLGPSTAAFVVAGLSEGKPGIKEWLLSCSIQPPA